uniref:Doublecortin domain-containing protein 2-like n=1 Tax=Oryzias melastigma TaxID=30732 RepID=A0A3B3BW11_ORYME
MATRKYLPVVVYRNGDPFYTGRRFVVNQRQVATMEAFLNEVTRSIRAPLAVRTLYTPKQGHRVTDLQDLQTGAQYVAAVHPNPHKYIVFRNGDLLCAPLRLIIPRSMRQDLEQILCVISEKVNLRTGAVRRLCSLEGGTVSSAGELETGHCYVAVGTERFKKLPYEALLASKATERYVKLKIHKKPSQVRYPLSNGSGRNSYKIQLFCSNFQLIMRHIYLCFIHSYFFYIFATVYSNIFQKEVQNSKEDLEGAEEVQEDENTATELPVDQVSFFFNRFFLLNCAEKMLKHKDESERNMKLKIVFFLLLC